ncbi:MAG: serine/threonine-protein kinase [Gemmatales bacterium]
MMQNRPPGESASPPENVVFLDSSNLQPSHSPKINPAEPATQTPPVQAELFNIDGGTTIKSGGMPPSAWQSNAAELAKLLPGKQLGIYLIEQALGTGGMAAVFRAVDPHLDRTVALKVLPPILAAQQEHVQRFEREAKVAAHLEHENVARVHFYGQDQGLHFIAYEYIEGINLREMLEQKGGRLDVKDAINYMTQAARGLAHSSSRGITHRDIKPSNLVITPHGLVKLVDLGLARNCSDDDTDGLTQSGATLGTFDYLSPEQAIDPRLADVRSDIYSLGCTFYHALTGIPPVPEGTAARKLHSHQSEMPRDPRELNPAIPVNLVDVLGKMMVKRPEDRFQNADDLVSALEQLTQPKVELTSTRHSEELQSAGADFSWLGAIVVLLFIVGCVVGYDVWKSSQMSGKRDSSIVARYLETSPERSATKIEAMADPKDALESPLAIEVESSNDLLQALKRPGGGTIYLKRSLYEINATNRLAVRGGEWTIRPVEGNTVTVRLLEGTTGPLFDVSAGILHLQQLKLELANSESVGILAQDAAQITIQQCELIRKTNAFTSFMGNASTARPFIQIINTNTGTTSTASLEVKGTLWHASAGIGVSLETPGYIHFDDCWVAPQYQFVSLPPLTHSTDKRLINMRRTTIAQPVDSCFRVMGASPVRLELDRCLFSRINSASINPGDESCWLVIDDGSNVDLLCSESLFYRQHAFCSVQKDRTSRAILARDWSQLRQSLARFRDEGSSVIHRSPWQENRPWQRYLDTHSLTALVLKPEYVYAGPENLLGQPFKTNGLASREIGEPTTPRGNRTLVVDGTGEEPGTFSTLNSALGSITDEEETTIILQLQGFVPIKPTEIGNSRVIIKAAEGFRPELTFHRDTVAGPDGEAHLFRIHDGEILLEGVRLRLESLRDPAKILTLMSITGAGRCRLKDSIVTLKGNGEFNATVCTVVDPTGIMSPSNIKSPRASLARMECADTIIRGSGQVLYVQTSRPFSAQLQQAAVALDGVLFTIEGNRSDMAMPSETAQLQLDRCTCYSSKGIVQLRASATMPQMLALRRQPTQSILAVGEGQPMIRLDVQQSDNDLKRKLVWQGKRNCYVSSGSFLAFQQLDQNSMATLYDASLWSELWGGDDEQAQFMKTAPMTGLLRQTSLSEWDAGEFVLKIEPGSSMGIRDIGIPVDAMPRSNSQTP